MRHFTRGSHLRRCAVGSAASGLAVALAFMLLLAGGGGDAQAVTVTTPYLAMTVQPGQTVTIDLTVS